MVENMTLTKITRKQAARLAFLYGFGLWQDIGSKDYAIVKPAGEQSRKNLTTVYFFRPLAFERLLGAIKQVEVPGCGDFNYTRDRKNYWVTRLRRLRVKL